MKGNESEEQAKINIATVGSKNRVCIPPKLIEHQNIRPGDSIVWVLKEDRKGVHYSIMHVVKPENFEVDAKEVVTISDTFKK